MILILSCEFDYQFKDDNWREKIVIFRQYIRYYSIKSIYTYLYSIYIIKKSQNNVLSKYLC